jgi:hypothetical protein
MRNVIWKDENELLGLKQFTTTTATEEPGIMN